MIRYYRVAFSALATCMLALGPMAPASAQDAPDALPEHPVIKPMNGATLVEDSSRADDFGQLLVRYRLDGKTIDETVEGKFWHLEYQLEDRDTSRDEIMANYAAEAERVGGEVLDRSGTRLRFRIVSRGGGTTWAILDTRANGAYELEIVDEAGLDLRDCKEITACTVDRRVVRCARGVGYPAGKACSAGARAHGAIAPGVGGD